MENYKRKVSLRKARRMSGVKQQLELEAEVQTTN